MIRYWFKSNQIKQKNVRKCYGILVRPYVVEIRVYVMFYEQLWLLFSYFRSFLFFKTTKLWWSKLGLTSWCLYISGYAIFVMFASFLLPLLVIIAAYGSMFRVAMRHARYQTHILETKSHQCYKEVKRHLKAAKTVAFVIGTFLCCWAPFIIVSVCYAFFNLDPHGASVTKWLAYLNAVLNPVVYTCVDKPLRRLVKKRLLFCFRKRFWIFSKGDHTAAEYSTPMATLA